MSSTSSFRALNFLPWRMIVLTMNDDRKEKVEVNLVDILSAGGASHVTGSHHTDDEGGVSPSSTFWNLVDRWYHWWTDDITRWQDQIQIEKQFWSYAGGPSGWILFFFFHLTKSPCQSHCYKIRSNRHSTNNYLNYFGFEITFAGSKSGG